MMLSSRIDLMDPFNDNETDQHSNNALRIQTDNLPPSSSTSTRASSFRSFSSLNGGGSVHSSPVLTPSGSLHHIPSTSLMPLPSPLVIAASQFPSSAANISLETLSLGSSPRRKGYGSLGLGLPRGVDNEKRNVTEFPTPKFGESGLDRSVSMSRTTTDDGLRREEILLRRQRTNSIDLEVYELDYWRTKDNEWEFYPTQYIKKAPLGRGTFSKVVLCSPLDVENSVYELLAIKIVNLDSHDTDAPAERITSSAKRELDILKKIDHPCITRLVAYKETPERCYFGLHYSRGGDLFDFASRQRPLLTPVLVKEIFKELVLAVEYLHETMHVVHRDLKLENILLNYPASDLVFPLKCPPPLIALTDLGLSRPYDPLSPLLTTRCGSTDYAAPEIMLGQPYDGRATDSWALGVILYCLLESRLPFDPPPDARRPGKVAHRIAMGQWKWYRLARERRTKSVTEQEISRDINVGSKGLVGKGDDGNGKFIRGGGVWEGGMEIVEGCLKRKAEIRWGVRDILQSNWLQSS